MPFDNARLNDGNKAGDAQDAPSSNVNVPFGTIPLNDGTRIPAIAFGTGTAFYEKDASLYVGQALESGFTHIDTAQSYDNEDSVGQAIRDSGLARDEIYVTGKYSSGNIETTVRTTLNKLGIKSLDLYLIHHPTSVKDLEAGWREMEQVKKDGLAKSIGVSNFTLEQLQTVVKSSVVKPAVNQIRFHPYNYAENKALLEYASKHGIVIEGYSSLTPITRNPGGPLDKVLATAAKKRNATTAQVLFAWVRAKGAVIVTTSSRKERLQEYLGAAEIEPLTEEEIDAIDSAGAQGPPRALSERRVILLVATMCFGLKIIFDTLRYHA